MQFIIVNLSTPQVAIFNLSLTGDNSNSDLGGWHFRGDKGDRNSRLRDIDTERQREGSFPHARAPSDDYRFPRP